MEVKELQNKIIEFAKKWAEKQKRELDEQITFNHLIEEIGEIASQYTNKKIRKNKYNKKELNNAIGDSLIHLIELAHINNLDIEKLITEIIKKDSKRI